MTKQVQALTNDQKALITEKFSTLAKKNPLDAREQLYPMLNKTKRATIAHPDDIRFLADLTDIVIDARLATNSKNSVERAHSDLLYLEEQLGQNYNVQHLNDTFRRHNKIIDAATLNPDMSGLGAAYRLIHVEREMIDPMDKKSRTSINEKAEKIYNGFIGLNVFDKDQFFSHTKIDALKKAKEILSDWIKTTPNVSAERNYAIKQSDLLFNEAVSLGSLEALDLANDLPKPKNVQEKRKRLTRLVDKALELDEGNGLSFAASSFLKKSDLPDIPLTHADIKQGQRIIAQANQYNDKKVIRNISKAISAPVPEEPIVPVEPKRSRNDLLNEFLLNIDLANGVIPPIDWENHNRTGKSKVIYIPE